MMHVLLESAAPAQARLMSWTSASVVTHGGIVAAALWLTLSPPVEPITRAQSEDIVYARPPVDPPPLSHAIVRHTPIPRLGAITIPAVDVPRITFPDRLPTIQSTADFPASRVFGDPRGTSPNPGGSGEPHLAHQVERIVRPHPGNPTPVYPSALRSAGVEGDVLVRFVVDTLGRVELRSVEVREATHALFADAVRAWLVRTRYDAATVRGERVRQLVEQRVGFSLKR